MVRHEQRRRPEEPGQTCDCNETTPAQDNCWFISAVDNGWYATGLIEVRQALPDLRGLAESLLKPMDFSIFYDNRPQTDCNVNASLGGQPTGQMYGGFYVDQGPAGYHNGALYSDPRIAMYVGMGRHQMPGDVWWRTWRTDPPARCATDPPPAFDPGAGYWHTYTDPQSGKRFPVWEGHYTYPGTSLTFVPTFAGGMFEGLMANLVVPETTWGTHSFGLDDLRWAQVQARYATGVLGYPVWGMSPSSTADDTGGYGGFGVQGQAFGTGSPLAWCTSGCGTEPESTVSPHASAIALPLLPQQALSNLETLRADYPGVYIVRRRLLRRGQPDDRRGRPPPPGARPVDDHGRAGRRARQRRAPAALRRRPGVVGRAGVSVRGADVDRVARRARMRSCASAP